MGAEAWICIAAAMMQMTQDNRELTWRERRELEDAGWFHERMRLNAEAMRAGSGWITAAKVGFVLWLVLVAVWLLR